ncbi:MAG: glycerophosphoryl diester phosphodiesterase membrane domain-containing protein [Pontixanthobacter sp.]
MKFDMNAAWADTTAMLKRNSDILAVMAAVFFFLPSLALAILAPTAELEAIAAANPDQLNAALEGYFAESWLIIMVYSLVSIVGTLAVFALFGRQTKPTVGEAIGAGVKGFLPYLASFLIVGIAVALAALLVGLITGASGAVVIGALLGIALLIVLVFVSVRLLLTGPIIAIEGVANPIAALRRSWRMVKGNTKRVFAFVLLIGIAILVVSMVVGFVFALIGSVFGPEAGLWIESILTAMLGAVTTLILLAAYVAIYRQLAGGPASALDTPRRDLAEPVE